MQIENIRFEHLYISQFNVRKTLNCENHEDDSTITELAANIKMDGLINPITVRQRDDGYEIIAGQRRYLALKYLGAEYVMCNIMNVSDRKAKELSLVENIHRNQMTYKDKVKAFSSLHDIYKSCKKISESAGLSERTIEKYIYLRYLPDDILNMLDGRGKEKITLEVALQLTKIKDHNLLLPVVSELEDLKNTDKVCVLKKFVNFKKQDLTDLKEIINPDADSNENIKFKNINKKTISIPEDRFDEIVKMIEKKFGFKISA